MGSAPGTLVWIVKHLAENQVAEGDRYTSQDSKPSLGRLVSITETHALSRMTLMVMVSRL